MEQSVSGASAGPTSLSALTKWLMAALLLAAFAAGTFVGASGGFGSDDSGVRSSGGEEVLYSEVRPPDLQRAVEEGKADG